MPTMSQTKGALRLDRTGLRILPTAVLAHVPHTAMVQRGVSRAVSEHGAENGPQAVGQGRQAERNVGAVPR